MNNKILAIAVGVLIVTALVSEAQAIRRAGSGGWGYKTMYGDKFDPETVETIQGEVVDVEKFTPLRQMAFGYKVEVKTAGGIIYVHLGPGYVVDREGFTVSPGDRVVVTGSKIDFDGEPTIIAMEIRDGNRELKLRSASGVPLWSELYKEMYGSD
jgi:hypothetical protein